MNIDRSISIALIGAAGVALAGYFVSHGLQAMKASERTVAVKGLSEREVNSNLALWTVGFTVTGDDLAATQAQLNKHAAIIAQFLEKADVAKEEISLGALKMTDKLANQYSSNTENGSARYILSTQLKVRSANIEAVLKASRSIGDVVRESGVLLGAPDQYGCDLRLVFTDLDKIKPEMIAQATQDARKAAEQFAKDSGVDVGGIRNASQGYFSISSRDGSDINSDSGSCDTETSVVKKVRVVTNVTYSLD
jgi:hypothetical protein